MFFLIVTRCTPNLKWWLYDYIRQLLSFAAALCSELLDDTSLKHYVTLKKFQNQTKRYVVDANVSQAKKICKTAIWLQLSTLVSKTKLKKKDVGNCKLTNYLDISIMNKAKTIKQHMNIIQCIFSWFETELINIIWQFPFLVISQSLRPLWMIWCCIFTKRRLVRHCDKTAII